jgi:hypothetical protein
MTLSCLYGVTTRTTLEDMDIQLVDYSEDSLLKIKFLAPLVQKLQGFLCRRIQKNPMRVRAVSWSHVAQSM